MSTAGRIGTRDLHDLGGDMAVFVELVVLVAPSLLEHVRGEVERETKLSKNLRIAREGRELAHPKRAGRGRGKPALADGDH